MQSVHSDPVDRTAHEHEVAAGDDGVHQPIRHFESLVGQQPMVSEGDADCVIVIKEEEPGSECESYSRSCSVREVQGQSPRLQKDTCSWVDPKQFSYNT